MSYITINFYFLIIALVILYYILPLKNRWTALLLGSAYFYFKAYKTGWWILFGTIIVTYLLAIIIDSKPLEKRKKLKQITLLIAIAVVALPWFAVKNGNFILSTLLHKNTIAWIAAMGMSFYTLQIISYLVDVYKRKIEVQKNPFKYALYVLYFPIIVQGPIPRYGDLGHQLFEGHRFNETKFVQGFYRIIWGFFLKLMIADKAGIVAAEIFDNYTKYVGLYILLAGILYSVELYADFMACVSISKGVSNLFGIDLTENFNHPYFAISIQDFWRRWHISLSSWLRDYIYIPLGGSRKGKIRKYINLGITFLVSGVWHGAGYKFIFWGALHAIYQIVGDITANPRNALYKKMKIKTDGPVILFIRRIETFIMVMFAWIIFRADHLKTGLKMIKNMFAFNPWILFNDSLFTLGLIWKEWAVLLASIALLIFVSAKQEKGTAITASLVSKPLAVRWLISMGAIILIVIFGTYGSGFDAQAFIYGGF